MYWMSGIGPKLPTSASQEVVSYVRYRRRACRTATIAVFEGRLGGPNSIELEMFDSN